MPPPDDAINREPGPGFDRTTGRGFASRSEVIASNAMAATSQPLATQVALDILRAGGHAVDAAIAANVALGLMEPTGNGIGGDLFAIVWDSANKELAGLNASGRAPALMTLDYLRGRRLSRIPATGPIPVSVPGAVDGWFELHDRFGRLDMAALIEPTVRYARDGFPVSEVIADMWARDAALLVQFPGFADTFMHGGRAPAKGEIFRNPRLADTLEAIAEGGRDEFYRGSIARRIDGYMVEQGGLLRYEDLAGHSSEWVEPASTPYRGWDVYELPPNSQGIAALQILNILECFDLRSMGFGSAEYVHTFVEAKKLAFADRALYYADPAFAKIPLDVLVSKDYAAGRARLISPDTAMQSCSAGDTALDNGDTVYLTTADAEGNMVSLIQSNYLGMGSGMTPGDLGFVLQNRAMLFSLDAGHANVVHPGKRPFQTIIPAFVMKDGKPLMSFGVMGGSMQPQGHAQILVNLLDFDMNLQEAGDAGRINHMGSSSPTGDVMSDGGVVHLERHFARPVRDRLSAMGHKLGPSDGGFGGYQAIMRDTEQGVYYGASESRKDGQAAGY